MTAEPSGTLLKLLLLEQTWNNRGLNTYGRRLWRRP